MPISWEEPFGIVMAEALACGAPVVGLARGAVAEVVEDGVTGFVCETVDGLIDAVGRIDQINRRNCRVRAEMMFSEASLVDGYAAVYRDLIAGR
jgi:glycosyltransferase involved in cell wall biosynthesis